MIRRAALVFTAFCFFTLSLVTGAQAGVIGHQAGLYAQQHHAEIAKAVAAGLGYLGSHFTAWTTHWSAPPKIKATIAAVFSLIAGAAASAIWAPGQPWYDWVQAIFYAVAASQVGYLFRNLPVIGSANLQLVGPIKVGQVAGAPDVPPPSPVTPNAAPVPEEDKPAGA